MSFGFARVNAPDKPEARHQLHPLPRGLVELYGLIAVLVVLIPEWLAEGTLNIGSAATTDPLAHERTGLENPARIEAGLHESLGSASTCPSTAPSGLRITESRPSNSAPVETCQTPEFTVIA